MRELAAGPTNAYRSAAGASTRVDLCNLPHFKTEALFMGLRPPAPPLAHSPTDFVRVYSLRPVGLGEYCRIDFVDWQ